MSSPTLRHLMKPFTPFLSDPAVDEVCVNGPGDLAVRRSGAWEYHDVPALDLDTLLDIGILAAAHHRRDVGTDRPMLGCDINVPDRRRLQFCQPPAVAADTVSLTIRRPGDDIHSIEEVSSRYELNRWNKWQRRKEQMDDGKLLALYDAGELVRFLTLAVQEKKTCLLCGPTGSGKTTMGITLIDAIPLTERLITIESALEYRLRHRNKVALLYSDDPGSELTPNLCMKASLRMRPDRVLVQELRDSEEAWTYVEEVVSGHPGSITTIHGRNAAQAFKKLFSLVKGSKSGAALDDQTVAYMLASAIDLIVPFENRGSTYEIGEVWFAADAARRGETAADLLRDI